MNWLTDPAVFWWTLGAGLVMLVGSAIGAGVVIVTLPADAWTRPTEHQPTRTPWFWAWRIAKNLLGAALVIAGVLMLFLPGQGVLTILIGVMLLDFPGKRQLELRLLRRPGVLSAINRLRARFNRPPLEVRSSERQGAKPPSEAPSSCSPV